MTPRFKTVLLGGWMALTTLGLAALVVDRAHSDPKVATFDTIDVQRLNVVEPNGVPRVVIANKGHFPGAFMGGKEYGHYNRHAGGFLFFNDEGDEVGGLIFDNNKGLPGGPEAMANLSMDQHKQDETVSLNYTRHNGENVAGLTVADRPDWSIEPLLGLSDKASHAKTPAERAAAIEDMKAFIKAKGHSGQADRLFAGKEGGESLVRLADKEGRPRLVLKVDAAGEPSIELLDGAGKVSRRITGS
jgi:hypothetical protein